MPIERPSPTPDPGLPRGGNRCRPRIAVILDNIDHLSGGYEPQLRAAFDSSCRDRDIDLMVVVGRALDHPLPSTVAQNRLYDLLDASSADGVIFVSSGLLSFSGPERIVRMHERLSPRAACSIGVEVPGIASVVVDNRPGMDALLEHVIAGHGRRRLAFIAGPPKNPDAEARFAAYRDALTRHGIEFDPDLVVSGNFHTPTASRASLELLRRNIPFDALIAANDAMALAAMDALKADGLRIPRDVVVTGFDDLVHARLASPPLTTVRQPLERLGLEAVRLIADQLAGKEVPPRVELPVEFVPRESCGCSTRWMGRAPSGAYPAVHTTFIRSVSSDERSRLFDEVGRVSLDPRGASAPWIGRLIEALEVELAGTTGEFLSVLEEVLDRVGDGHDGFERLGRALDAMRSGITRRDLAPLWLTARAALDAATARAHARQRLEVDVVFQDVMRSGERLSTGSLDPTRLNNVIAEETLAMGHRNAVVSVYGSEGTTLKPLIWLHEGKVKTPSVTEFAPSELVLPEACDRRRTWFVHALTFQTEQLGVVAFEIGPASVTFEMLRGQISTALKTAALHREIVETTAMHERSVQERLATVERMASLSVLAGGVAHDLNNALGPLVMLPDVILGQLEDLRKGQLKDDHDLRLDVNTIKSSATRAAQTIKDLLMIGRPGATAKEPLDLNEAVVHCMSTEPLRFLKNGASQLRVTLDLDRGPLTISASEPHIVRALTNLVRNAAEAIAGSGEIRVSTASVRLADAIVSHEAIPPGEYCVVRVADNGQGISPEDIARIFQPFFSRKARSDTSGSGLGLAIVHGVVKEHGGYVTVESRLGKGTLFTLYFRRTRAPLGQEREAPPTAGGSARILLVDDEPTQLHSARRLLCQLGYEVDTLESGEEAFRIFSDARRSANLGEPGAGTPYDLVILDYALNEARNGLETLERIRTLYPRQRGIMVSGHGRAEHEGRALARVPWLPKPYSADALAGIVRRTLDMPVG